jgi:uncharacterized protein
MNSFLPLEKQNRLLIVDALRGLALFGILLANIPFSEAGSSIYQLRNIVLGSPGTDKILSFAVHLLIEKKFITIFSILFGFGFYMQIKRAEEKGIAFRSYFVKRMILLLVIGCVHAYLFWFGDIIRDYAICGILLLLVYKWPVKRILITAIIFSVFFTALVFILNGVFDLQEYPYDRAILTEHPVAISYWRYLQINFTIDPFINFIHDSPITLVFVFGCMLIGFLIGKSDFFVQPTRFRKVTKWVIITGSTIGLLCSYLFWLVTTGKLELTPTLLWLPFVIVTGLLLQSLFYIAAFVKLFQQPFFKKIVLIFVPVGQMALSNYLLQTVFYLLFFFHWAHGLQLYGKITLTETYLAAILLFGLQIIFSNWWLRSHRQGPVEYVWKKLSYQWGVKGSQFKES